LLLETDNRKLKTAFQVSFTHTPSMTTIQKRLTFTFVATLALIFVLIWISLSTSGAPDLVRRLPSADAYTYIDLRPVRLFMRAKGITLPATQHEPDYDTFVKATGFEFERDLDQVAIAVHPFELVKNETGDPEFQRRYSEFFRGTFDPAKLAEWLRTQNGPVEKFDGTEIYSIAYQSHTVRVAILDSGTVAVSNMASPEIIHGMVRASHQASWNIEGPAVIQLHYSDVPVACPFWMIGSFTSLAGKPTLPLPGGVDLNLPAGSVSVTSLGISTANPGGIELKMQAITPSVQDAQQFTSTAQNLLQIFRAASTNTSGPDADAKAFFDSIQVTQEGQRAILSAQASFGFFKKAFSGSAQTPAPVQSPPPISTPQVKPSQKKLP